MCCNHPEHDLFIYKEFPVTYGQDARANGKIGQLNLNLDTLIKHVVYHMKCRRCGEIFQRKLDCA